MEPLDIALAVAFAASWISMLLGIEGYRGWRRLVRLTAAASATLLIAKLALDTLVRLGIL